MKRILITGATSGIGFQTALELAQQGHQVVITGRRKEHAEEAVRTIVSLTGNKNIDCLTADLSLQSGVEVLASAFQDKYDTLDVLVNNAGSAATEFTRTKDGLELNVAVNVRAPFLLTKLLIPVLKKGNRPRVITLSGGSLPKSPNITDLQNEARFSGLSSYSDSKMLMLCVMYDFAEELHTSGIAFYVCYPGQASTSMTRSVTKEMFPKMVRFAFPLFRWFTREDGGKSAAKASRSSVFLATTVKVEGRTNLYYDKNVRLTDWPVFVQNSTNRKNARAFFEEML